MTMRNLLIAALAFSSIPSSDSDACGFEEPQVLMLSSHGVSLGGSRWATRTFAVLGDAAPADANWRMLAPGTYDGTRIADASPLERAQTMTLVGRKGTRIVTTSDRSFLAPAWGFRTPSAVLAVDAGDDEYVVALRGKHPKAAFGSLEERASNARDISWVKAHGVTPEGQVYVSHLPGTTIDTITVTPKNKIQQVTFVRSGDSLMQQVDGSPLGSLTERNMRYILVAHDGAVTPVWTI
jgi:hypothetical protein